MSGDPGRDGRRGIRGVATAAALLALVGLVLIGRGLSGSGVTPPAPSGAATSAGAGRSPAEAPRESPEPTPDAPRAHAFLGGSRPVALRIPSIGLTADRFVDLGLAGDGSIEVPTEPMRPGWFRPGPSPGQVGPSIIAGHVDSKTGPAVFYRLGDVRPADRISVRRQDGTVASFGVDRVQSFPKDAFPTRLVYGTTDRAELRLITCGGRYDRKRGYVANVVVFAHLVGSR